MSNETKHTPGPLEVRKRNASGHPIYTVTGVPVAVAYSISDARLFAIAPELADRLARAEADRASLREALEWALDLLDMDDKRLSEIDPAWTTQLDHAADFEAKTKARALLFKTDPRTRWSI